MSSTHAVESCVSLRYNEFSEALSQKAIEIVGSDRLRSYLDNNDTHARQKMHTASTLAGLAFTSAGLGSNHGMAHQLGAHFHIPHGAANAMLLPHVIEYNSEISARTKSRKEYSHATRCYATIARVLGLQNFQHYHHCPCAGQLDAVHDEGDGHGSQHVRHRQVHQEEYEALIPVMAEGALKDSCTADNPRTPTKEEVEQLYRDLW